jgi:hypothetical protein
MTLTSKELAEKVRKDKKARFTDFCLYPSARQGKADCP